MIVRSFININLFIDSSAFWAFEPINKLIMSKKITLLDLFDGFVSYIFIIKNYIRNKISLSSHKEEEDKNEPKLSNKHSFTNLDFELILFKEESKDNLIFKKFITEDLLEISKLKGIDDGVLEYYCHSFSKGKTIKELNLEEIIYFRSYVLSLTSSNNFTKDDRNLFLSKKQ